MLDASEAPTQAQVSASDAAASSGCVLRTMPGAKRLHARPAVRPPEHSPAVILKESCQKSCKEPQACPRHGCTQYGKLGK